MLKGLRDHWPHIARGFGRKSKQTRSVSQPREVRVFEVSSKVNDASRLHFQLNKSQRLILEDDDLDGSRQLTQRQKISQQHSQTAISRQRHNLPSRMAHLGADCLG